MVQVRFFGALQDAAGGPRRELALPAALPLSALVARLGAGDPALAAALGAPAVRVAVNAELRPAACDLVVQPHDEVAFMPPFSGG